jgi:hypothetical protein
VPEADRPVGAELDLAEADPDLVGVQDADLDPPRGARLQASMEYGVGCDLRFEGGMGVFITRVRSG